MTLTRFSNISGQYWAVVRDDAKIGFCKIVGAHLDMNSWQALTTIYIWKNGARAVTLSVNAAEKDWTFSLEFSTGDKIALEFYFDGIISGTYADNFEFYLDFLTVVS